MATVVREYEGGNRAVIVHKVAREQEVDTAESTHSTEDCGCSSQFSSQGSLFGSDKLNSSECI